MPDPHLEALLKGTFIKVSRLQTPAFKNKDRFELAAEKWVEGQLTKIDFAAECYENKLLSPAMKRAQKRIELLQMIENEEKPDLLIQASNLVLSEGHAILGADRYEALIDAFKDMHAELQKLDLESNLERNPQSILKIQDDTLESLDEIAIDLFSNSRFVDCQAICTLLFTLVPENGYYFYRAAMAAQNDGNRIFALKAYDMALSRDPTLIGALLFAAECHLTEGMSQQAAAYLEKSSALIQTGHIDQPWVILNHQLKEWLKSFN
jgi:tetratricopeptide (TPR) repeat protein